MFCIKCGKEYQEGEKFCSGCGNNLEEKVEETGEIKLENQAPVYQQIIVPKRPSEKFSGLAIAGFVLGLVAFFIMPIFIGVPGLIFSCTSFKDVSVNNKRGKGLAIAGLVLGIINVVWGILSLTVL